MGVGFHAFEWLFFRLAPIVFVGAVAGIFLTRKKCKTSFKGKVKKYNKKHVLRHAIYKNMEIKESRAMKLKNILIVVKDIEKSNAFIMICLVLIWCLIMTVT